MAESGRRSCTGRLARWGAGLGVLGLLLAGVGLGVLGTLYQDHVVNNPGDHLERAHIRSIIAQESPVYYRDAKTRIGVFFADEHRQYVPFDELPAPYVMAIVASEDGGFWGHPGVNVRGIVRAMRDNLRAGHVVAGGSTLTQQTAKNLYYRPDRSLHSKGVELLNALRLEAHYSKAEILTFYVNQFHVSGNGRGLGIAARYFFDKEVDELSLVECAFLAGLVKSPGRYDPFLGDEARRTRATQRAQQRTRYVLGRLAQESVDHLSGPYPVRDDRASLAAFEARKQAARAIRIDAQQQLDQGFTLNFKHGAFRYDSSALLDEVALRLGEPPFDQVLAQAGIDDPDTAGLVVITTLDPDVQRSATYGLWHHLTEAGSWMEKLQAEDFVREGRGPRFDPDRPPVRHTFRLGTVVAQTTDDQDARTLSLDLGGHGCTLDRAAVVRAAVSTYRGEKGSRTAKASSAWVDGFLDRFSEGQVVWVSVRELTESGAICDLEVRPELQGAVMVTEAGQIRAMVGGNDNQNFNRATALRQMGSTFKPLIYHAALELGWSPADTLDNTRNIFPFSTTAYWPRPDHHPTPVVSMAWAGVRSENLASIWLLYHLIDKLDQAQVAKLAAELDLAPRPGELERAFVTRIQKAGVMSTTGRRVEGLFLQAKAAITPEVAEEDALALRTLLYGRGYDKERSRAARMGPRDRALRQRALTNSWTALQPMLSSCAAQHSLLSQALSMGVLPAADTLPDLSVLVDGDRVRVACGAMPEGYAPVDDSLLAVMQPEPLLPRGPFYPRVLLPAASGPVLDGHEAMRVEDRVSFQTLQLLDEELSRLRLEQALEGEDAPGLYDPRVLYWNQDFRVLLGMRYVAALAAEYGVRTELKPILSMPLGASEITLEEVVTLYGGLTTGHAMTFPGEGPGGARWSSPPAPALLISELRDVDGNVLYRARPVATEVAPPAVADMTSDILRNVVRWGTGRRASGALQLKGGVVPLGGKTGTTNDFRNAVFAGFVPQGMADGYDVGSGYVVGVYAGYDDNRPMRNGHAVLAGSSGALPAWIGTVQGLADAGLVGAPSGPAPEGGRWPLQTRGGVLRVPVDRDRGGQVVDDVDVTALDPSRPSLLVRLPSLDPVDLVVTYDADRPVRVAPSTERAVEAVDERRRRHDGRRRLWGRRKR